MKIPAPDIEEMKRLVQKKAKQLLAEFTEDNLNYFLKEASIIAESIMERFIFAVYDLYTTGELAIKDPYVKEAFTNYKSGYQQKMLDWKERNVPSINSMETSPTIQKPSVRRWRYAFIGVGAVGAIGLIIGQCYWFGLTIILITLAVSVYFYLKEKKKRRYEYEQCKSGLIINKEIFVNEVISHLENWLKQGEIYSNELLTTFHQ